MAGGHGGARRNAGRKPGQRIKRTQEIVAGALAEGLTPLGYMLETLRNPQAEQHRRDEAARNAAPFVHPKLNALAVNDLTGDSGGTLELKIYSVPRGCQVGADGVIRHADGTPATAAETAFEPFVPTPALALTDQSAAPVEPPGPVTIDLETEPAVTRLDRWRDRKRDDGPGAA
jgi:hypothetical protein